MNELKTIWNFNLISTKGGIAISVGDVSLALLLIFAGYLISKIAELVLARRLEKTDLKADSVMMIRRVIFYMILVMVGLTVLGVLGIPITAFAFATGAIAIGIGFGAQNIINNFISGWILMAERPIRVDDFIEVDGSVGTVMRVGTRSTLIHRLDGVHVLLPNSKLLENTVVNWTLLDGFVRSVVRVGVAYGSNVEKTVIALKRAIESCPDVLKEPATEYVFEDFGDNALIFDVTIWCDVVNGRAPRLVRSDLRFAIERELARDNIVIAFPQRDIHFDMNKPLRIQLEKGEG